MPKATSTKLEPFKLNFLKFLASSAHIKKLNKDKFLSLSLPQFSTNQTNFYCNNKTKWKNKKEQVGQLLCTFVIYMHS